MFDEHYKMLSVVLASILALIVAGGTAFAFLNRHYVAAWYRKVSSDEPTVSPFLEQRVQAFRVAPSHVPEAQTWVFAGDSLVETFPWDEHFGTRGNPVVINRGVYGDTIEGLASRFDVSFPVDRRPVIFLMVGANDMTGDASCAERFVDRYRALLTRLVDAGIPADRLFVHSLLPARRADKSNRAIIECNRALSAYTAEHGIGFVDLHAAFVDDTGKLNPDLSLDDGLHPNSEGYRVWLEILRREIAKSGLPDPGDESANH